jgi:hypothetical protein
MRTADLVAAALAEAEEAIELVGRDLQPPR